MTKMTDNLRIRLQFRGFVDNQLRNSLLWLRRSEIKDLKSLEKLVESRFQIRQPVCLSIDNFVLEQTEPIDILRDNDLIVVEPKPIVPQTIIKTKSIENEANKPLFCCDSQNYSSTPVEKKAKTDESPIVETKTNRKPRKYKRKISEKYILDSDSSSDSNTSIDIKSNCSSRMSYLTLTDNRVCNKLGKTCKETQFEIETDSKQLSSSLICSDLNTYSSRKRSVRKAFETAIIKNKKQLNTSNPNEADSRKTAKQKRLTQEARDLCGQFSPYIILERITVTENSDSESKTHFNHTASNFNQVTKKQSARKSFSTPSSSSNNSNDNDSTKHESETTSSKTIDCDDCEPLCEAPKIGDVVAFKILTLSKDGKGYEASQFNMGSVLYVNSDNSMVDVLLENTIKRRHSCDSSETDELVNGIHALKLNWSTVLEPKLIQRCTSFNSI